MFAAEIDGMFTKGMQHVDKLNTSLKGESECFPAYVVALCEKHKIHSWHASRIERTLRKYCMGKLYSELTDKQIDFIEQQKIFFVGTAAETGTVNISPKAEIRCVYLMKILSPGSTIPEVAMNRLRMCCVTPA